MYFDILLHSYVDHTVGSHEEGSRLHLFQYLYEGYIYIDLGFNYRIEGGKEEFLAPTLIFFTSNSAALHIRIY